VLNDRLRKLRKTLKLNQTEFGARIGVTDGAISRLETGSNNVTDLMVIAVCREFNVNETWLRTGEGEMFIQAAETAIDALVEQYGLTALERGILEGYVKLSADVRGKVKQLLVNAVESAYEKSEEPIEFVAVTKRGETSEPTPAEIAEPSEPPATAPPDEDAAEDSFYDDEDAVEIIVFNQPAAAGLGNYLFENGPDDYELMTLAPGVVPAGADIGVRISGDSMQPRIPDGAVVWVQPAPQLENGQIGVFVLNGEALCKRIAIDWDERQVRLESLNPAYAPIVVTERDNLRTIGRVLGHM
jgi:phage repressor protein C with HTH and peptisase S24 domain